MWPVSDFEYLKPEETDRGLHLQTEIVDDDDDNDNQSTWCFQEFLIGLVETTTVQLFSDLPKFTHNYIVAKVFIHLKQSLNQNVKSTAKADLENSQRKSTFPTLVERRNNNLM